MKRIILQCWDDIKEIDNRDINTTNITTLDGDVIELSMTLCLELVTNAIENAKE